MFHGHAHHGQPEGRTRKDVPVFNVSMSLMRERIPDRPFRLVDDRHDRHRDMPNAEPAATAAASNASAQEHT